MGILRSLEFLVLLVQAKRTIKKILYKYLSLGCPNAENRRIILVELFIIL